MVFLQISSSFLTRVWGSALDEVRLLNLRHLQQMVDEVKIENSKETQAPMSKLDE